MKKIVFILFVVVILTSVSIGQVRTGEKKTVVNKTTGDTTYTESVIISVSEDITARNSMLVVNPLKFFLFYNISYFHKVSESVIIGGGLQVPTVSGLSGFGVNAEVRFHPSGKNMRGFYIAPNIAYNSLSEESGGNANLFSFGGLAGWQWFPSDEFAIGLGIGLDYYTGSGEDENDVYGSVDGFVPAVRFDIGYAW
ncbi:MAG: hypothetical protein KAI45_00180 [Melioribacteraceae bacterium]|nr:hypothetical protein [Melioribacteraceae bacterium]